MKVAGHAICPECGSRLICCASVRWCDRCRWNANDPPRRRRCQGEQNMNDKPEGPAQLGGIKADGMGNAKHGGLAPAAGSGEPTCPNPNCVGGRIRQTNGGCCICERPFTSVSQAQLDAERLPTPPASQSTVTDDISPAQQWLKVHHRPLLMALMSANIPGLTGLDLAALLTDYADYRIKPILDHLSGSGSGV